MFVSLWSMCFVLMWYKQIINNTIYCVLSIMQKMTFLTCEMLDAYEKAKLSLFPTKKKS